jgi:TrmH family RNA methyltransferase
VSLSRQERQRIAETARGRGEEGVRLLEGPKSILDALPTGAVLRVFAGPGLADETRTALLEAAGKASVPVAEGDAADFDRLKTSVTPQGALAFVRDVARPLADILARPGLLLWLDGVQDPGNVGAVVRTAAALGAAGVVAGEGTADPLGLKALRASAGHALRVPFCRARSEEVASALRAARRPCWLLDAAGEDLLALRERPGDLVLALGAEGRGPGEVARAASSRRVGIPLAQGVESLNAAVAAGIALAALLRMQGT